MIDRRALVDRHTCEVTQLDPRSPLSVGNGELCFTADLTGLQSFPDYYPVEDPGSGRAGTLLATQSQWGWHSMPGAAGHDLAATRRSYQTPRGPVPYVDMQGQVAATGEAPATATESWLRNNPHRLDLVRIGLVQFPAGGGGPRALDPAQLTDIHQRLDLWSGILTSQFQLPGAPVRVVTACHPSRDVIGVRIEAGQLLAGLAVRLAFPYGDESWSNAADWTQPQAHASALTRTPTGVIVRRVLDDTTYYVHIGWSPGAELRPVGAHELLVTAATSTLELRVGFSPDPPSATGLPEVAEICSASDAHWAAFWTRGAAVELADSTDPRAPELERRTVLSQYLTAIHCAGSLPPQETGLMVNSWRGRFHLEMHWWHAAHFPLWGRAGLLERSLWWYESILPQARQTARVQGYAGARWPKQVGPDGRESPSPIGPFLIWQQPHPIYLAELVRRASGAAALTRYAEIVFASAEFMADFAIRTEHGYQLGPPLVPAQESYASLRASLTNPTFELAYWQWGLRTASRWRELLGLPSNERWRKVADHMGRPAIRHGRYAALDVPPYLVRTDHPSMVCALGMVPPTDLVDSEVMRATLHDVLGDWAWESTWGWDYPALAMTATRLGEPQAAVAALSLPTAKNTYLPNGHNRQTPWLPVYLPGNGGLLTAVALMAGGADTGPHRPTPGFPDDGRWRVRQEGLHPLP